MELRLLAEDSILSRIYCISQLICCKLCVCNVLYEYVILSHHSVTLLLSCLVLVLYIVSYSVIES